MPIYEYQCEDCQHKLEAIQKVSDAPLTECPACSAQSLKKLVSAAAFHLKGTGWYATDFKDKPKAADETKQKEGASTNKDPKKPESKTADGDSKKTSTKEPATAD